MTGVTKELLTAGLAALALVGLGGCFWVSKDLPARAAVFFSDLIGSVGGPGEVTVSVTGAPCGGLAALVVGWGGIGLRFDPAQFRVTDIQGRERVRDPGQVHRQHGRRGPVRGREPGRGRDDRQRGSHRRNPPWRGGAEPGSGSDQPPARRVRRGLR
ncbi:MAG TPA: hypothetical protein ENN96_02635 [Candidatus Acetothermia bacterium]|nr:hypothetical protein [Candidatus Acetothermia bacterium]